MLPRSVSPHCCLVRLATYRKRLRHRLVLSECTDLMGGLESLRGVLEAGLVTGEALLEIFEGFEAVLSVKDLCLRHGCVRGVHDL